MRKVLFVDDEPKVLEGLRRMLRPLRDEWEMAFAGGGTEALELLAQAPFHVVVTDMRMPGMDGAELLAEVRRLHPSAVRFLLTGQCGRDAILRAVNLAHRLLAKPCDAQMLKAAVRRACALRDLLADGPLLALLSRLESIPSMPDMYAQVFRELDSPEASMRRVGEIIAQDVGLSAKILQMIHSAFFGVGFHVVSPAQAVVFLGAETTKVLLLAATIYSRFDAERLKPFSIDGVWAHSQVVSRLAGRVARAEGCGPKDIESAGMAGLLHDTGKLVLAGHLPSQYRQVLAVARARQIPVCVAEREIFGATHAEVGAYLLGLWGLPDSIVEAVAWHHRPGDCPAGGFGPLAAVHVADAISYENDSGRFDDDYLARLGVAGRVSAWRALAGPLSGDRGEGGES